ncbi:MAG: branched-chain amino acid transferase [Alphaproteobacteria bacterium]|nr:branched-chain amino acid transferase [Alphaproteobacteria bacterium]
MADGIVHIDGAFVPADEARISIFDLGFLRGDAVYDTVSVWKGMFFRLDDHIERFMRSCAGMRLACPHEPEAIKRILASCVSRAGLEDSYVQMIVTRGRFNTVGKRDVRRCENKFIGLALPYIWIISPEKQTEGIDLAIVENRRTPTESIDPTVKNFNWMDLQRGLFQALDRDADHAVLLTTGGVVAEGPGFNLFWIKRGRLMTPKGNVLEGITRRTVADIATEMGIAVEFGDFPADALRGADEAFLSSTAGGIMPVTRIDGKPLGNGAPGILTGRIREAYWSKREAGWLGTPVASLLGRQAAA